jgi:pimeloyl-ACP methyl ester carboxylesterase
MTNQAMTVIGDLAPAPDAARVLLVMLPGAYMSAEDFISHGFVAALGRYDWPIDVIAVETGIDRYLDNCIAERLNHELIMPALARGYRRIWLLGISLGGMGALLHAQAHPKTVEGILLLSPFLGTRGLIAEIAEAGGLRHWPGVRQAPTYEQSLLTSLRQYQADDESWAKMLLAYGVDDRFAAAHRLLAELLPQDRVFTAAGGHDWETWTALWHRMLRSAPFGILPPRG